MAQQGKTFIIVAVIVLIFLFVYAEGKGAGKNQSIVVANQQGATPGFTGEILALELNNAFKQGWFGNTQAKADVLRKIDGLSSADLGVLYNVFNRKYSRNFNNKTMKQVIADEWITWIFEPNLQTKIVAKLDALNLP